MVVVKFVVVMVVDNQSYKKYYGPGHNGGGRGGGGRGNGGDIWVG